MTASQIVAAEFVLGSRTPHRHDLVLARYVVRTDFGALRAGEQRSLREGRL